MKATITPFKPQGTIVIPPSKSMSHRAIICASLASGTSTIKNITWSQDILVTMEGMKKLGADIQKFDDYAIITGIKDIKKTTSQTIFCNESGSTLRFFIPIFSLTQQAITFTGKGRLMERPQSIYQDIFQKQDIPFIQDQEGIHIHGSLKPSHYELRGDISSQFISGLLFTLPLLEADSTIHISEPFESKSYIQLTIDMLKYFHVDVKWMDDNTLFIPGNQEYQAHDYTIEGDYSQFAFFAVLAAINHDLSIVGVDHQSHQGDKAILDILKQCGVPIQTIENGYHITSHPIHELTIDLKDCPDLGPILMVLGMYCEGTIHIINAGRLRLKESDRIMAMESELRKLNVDIHSTQDTITIHGSTHYQGGVTLSGHQDHRIVMSLAVASSLTKNPCSILSAQAITKSYPQFFDDLRLVHGLVELHDE